MEKGLLAVMMNAMRKHTKIILWVVVIAFLSTIFLVWGMGSTKRQEINEKTSAAVVNGEPISYDAFGRLWEQRFRQIFKDSEQEPSQAEINSMRQDLIQDMIDGVLMKQLAKKVGLKVFPQEVAARIAAIPSFQENNQFSRQKYLTLLQYNHITPEAFENEQKEAILFIKVSQYLKNTILTTDADLKDYFALRTRKVKLAYVAFDWEKEAPKITIPEEELRNYYDSHPSQFEKTEEVKAAHILLKVDPKASEADKTAIKLKLEDIRNQIVAGADFAKMAKKYSEDPGSKDQGGDLGYFHKGMMVPPFENAAFALKKGELSKIVETNFGFHLIKVLDKKPSRKTKYAQARPDILKQLREEKAKAKVQSEALVFAKALKASGQLTATAQAQKIPVLKTSWVREGDAVKGLSTTDQLWDQVLDLKTGQPSGAIFDRENIVFAEITAAEAQPFNATIFQLEKDKLTDKLKNILGIQARDAWLAQARAESTITNNIQAEAASETAPTGDETPAPAVP